MQGYFSNGVKAGLAAIAVVTIMSMFVVGNVEAATCGADPTNVTVDLTSQDVLPGGSVDYAVTIETAQTGCDMDLSIANLAAGFSASPADGATIAVDGNTAFTLTISATNAVAIGTENTINLTIDGDNNTGNGFDLPAITTAANNKLLHNSYNLGSSKWSGDNGWGLDTGKYGEFNCDTCHGKNTGNIKRVVNEIPATIGAAAVKPVNFQATTGANSFGDDTSAHASSTRICEVCHTYDATGADGVTVHAYNMPVTANHENNTDCISCHMHNTGFAASCSACHGDGGTGQIWPDGIDNNGGRVVYADDDAGSHDNHIAVVSNDLFGLTLNELINDPASTDKQKTICAFCHPDPGGGGHGADSGADARVDMQSAGSFEMLTEGAGTHGTDTGSGAYNLTEQSCSNLACHNLTTTPDITTDSAGWNNPPASPDCSMCHDSNGGTQRHDTHVGGSSFACIECHVDNGTFATGTTGVDHINGEVELKWDNAGSYEVDFGDSSASYSQTAPLPYQDATWGTCSGIACHANSVTPAWNDTGVGCNVCHSTTQTTGAHEYHMVLDGGDFYAETGYNSTTTQYDFGCADCHAGDSHVNGTTTVTTHGFNSTTKVCATADCHSGLDVNNAQHYKPTPAWDTGTFSGDRCAGCHDNSPESGGHEEHQVGFHYDAVYSGLKDFMPVLNSDPLPIGLKNDYPADNGDSDAMDDSYDPLRGHGGRIGGGFTSTTMTCNVCHNDTVTTSVNDGNPVCAACHNDTDAPLMGNMTIADKSVHVNGVRDVVFMREKVRSKAQVRDDLFDVPELANNWTRVNNYKQADGSSYDESPDTLYNMASLYGGWTTSDVTRYAGQPEEMTQPARTCLVSCHLWQKGRVDKYPIHWEDNSIHGPQPIMCIDCHTRLPK